MKAIRRKVLVVDDDPVIGRSFDRVLSDKGYAVSTAVNGREALDKLRREDIDVVFTDIKMPGMDGIEITERIREKRPWIPVVIITGYGTAANEAKAEAAGAAGFLHKPLSPEMIEASARNALQLIEGGKAAHAMPGTEPIPTPAKAIDVAAEPVPGAAKKASALKNVALLFAAPFLGLAYVLAFPFIGLALLAWIGARAFARRRKSIALFVKNVVLFFAAPFVGLAYALAFPFIGLALLIRMGAKTWAKRSRSE